MEKQCHQEWMECINIEFNKNKKSRNISFYIPTFYVIIEAIIKKYKTIIKVINYARKVESKN